MEASIKTVSVVRTSTAVRRVGSLVDDMIRSEKSDRPIPLASANAGDFFSAALLREAFKPALDKGPDQAAAIGSDPQGRFIEITNQTGWDLQPQWLCGLLSDRLCHW